MTQCGVGILLMLGQQLCFTCEMVSLHRVGGVLTIWQLALLRSLGGLVVVLCLLRWAPPDWWRTDQAGLQVVRALVTIGYTMVMVYAFTVIPMADATALMYTQAIYVVMLAPLILGERVLVRTLFLVRPSLNHVPLVYVGVLAGTSLNGLAVVLNRYMQRRDHQLTAMFYVSALQVLAFGWAVVQPVPSMSLVTLLWLLPVFVVGPLGTFLGIVVNQRPIGIHLIWLYPIEITNISSVHSMLRSDSNIDPVRLLIIY